jgi:hypothetical protein
MDQAVSRISHGGGLGSDPSSVHVGFVVEKEALKQGFPRVLRFSSVGIIPLVLHTSSFISDTE